MTGADLMPRTDDPASGPSPPPDSAPPEFVFGPRPGWRFVDLRELWRYRELLFALAWRDVQLRYKQTALGVAWAVLQPALTMAVFAVFLGQVARVPTGGVSYPLFAYAGLLPWLLFASGVTHAGNSVVGSEGLITKVYFPRLLLPLAAVLGVVVDFLVSLGLLGVLLAVEGFRPVWDWLLVPPLVGLVLLAGSGLGVLLAALNVSYRDVRYVIPFLIQVGLFATPSVYLDLAAATPPGGGPAAAVRVAYLNPMTAVVEAFRAAVLGQPLPWGPLAGSAAAILAVFLFGCWYFRRTEDEFADVI